MPGADAPSLKRYRSRRLPQPVEVGKVLGAEPGDERFERGDALLTQ